MNVVETRNFGRMCKVKGMFDCSDHFALLMKIKVRDRWIFDKVEKGVRKRLRSESSEKKE